MNESGYTSYLNKKMPQDIWVWKIHDDTTGGVPDVYYLNKKNGQFLWAEFKYLKTLPKRESTLIVPNLSELQKMRLEMLFNACHKVVVPVGFGSKGVILRKPHEWLGGITCEEFKKKMKSYADLRDEILDMLNYEY